MSGQRFGFLTAICAERSDGKSMWWSCKCDCGSTKSIRGSYLRSGHTQSCGCQRQRNTRKHGNASRSGRTVEYRAWQSMISRCTNRNFSQFKDYGGRGIAVCQAWMESFDRFLVDVGYRPSTYHTLGRINNDGNYEPGNVEWQTRKAQQNNRRDSLFIDFNGRRMTAQQWSDELGVPRSTIIRRSERGVALDIYCVPTTSAAVDARKAGR